MSDGGEGDHYNAGIGYPLACASLVGPWRSICFIYSTHGMGRDPLGPRERRGRRITAHFTHLRLNDREHTWHVNEGLL